MKEYSSMLQYTYFVSRGPLQKLVLTLPAPGWGGVHHPILTLHGAANKVRKLVLILKLTQEPKKEICPRKVRIQRGPHALGLI